jgi:hypothetical protein
MVFTYLMISSVWKTLLQSFDEGRVFASILNDYWAYWEMGQDGRKVPMKATDFHLALPNKSGRHRLSSSAASQEGFRSEGALPLK